MSTILLKKIKNRKTVFNPITENKNNKRHAFSMRQLFRIHASSGVHLKKIKRSYVTEVPYAYYPSVSSTNNIREVFPVLSELEIGHINKIVFQCAFSACVSLRCNGLCSKLISCKSLGNFTHTPPKNSDAILISAFDINGNPQKQYFVFNKTRKPYVNDPTESKDSGLRYSKKADDYDPRT